MSNAAADARLHYEFLRLDYMSRNPPAKPLCSTPTLLSDGEGNVFMQHGDIVNGLVCYRNPSGGYGDNLYNPVKHSFTGWLSPCGFLLSTPAGQSYAHSVLAASICERLGLGGDPECALEDAGWLRLQRSQIVGPFDPNEVQAGILCHLNGM